jgi:hypothetical protein
MDQNSCSGLGRAAVLVTPRPADYVYNRIDTVLECQRPYTYDAVMATERFEMRYPPDLLKKIDEWCEQQPAPPSRAAAIRYLIELGLEHAKKPTKRSRS